MFRSQTRAACAVAVVAACALLTPAGVADITAWGQAGFVPPPSPTRYAAIDASLFHSIGVTPEGVVACWGTEYSGECTVPADVGVCKGVGAGFYHSVALRTDGTLRCWGDNTYGQCDVPPGLGPVKQVSVFGFDTVALLEDGTVAAWGENLFGENDIPPGLVGVKEISAGGYFVIALKSNGTIVCWGNNEEGQCLPPANVGTIQHVSAGQTHAMALRTDGTVVCWGENQFGQTTVPPLPPVTQIAAGEAHSMAIGNDGVVRCWGYNDFGQCDVPPNVGLFSQIAGANHSLAVRPNGTIIAWGRNNEGQCFIPDNRALKQIATGPNHTALLRSDGGIVCYLHGADALESFPLPNLPPASEVAVGDLFTVALCAPGTIFCWGDDTETQCEPPPGLFLHVAAAGSHALAVGLDGLVSCWGSDVVGESTPPLIPNPVTQVAAGFQHSVALQNNGLVVCWGANNFGQCNIPPGLGPVKAISAGRNFTVAVRMDGSVVCWGQNNNGQCNVPANLGAVQQVAAGFFHVAAIRQDGSLQCWGKNNVGQCNPPPMMGDAIQLTASNNQTVAYTKVPDFPVTEAGYENYAITEFVKLRVNGMAWGPDAIWGTSTMYATTDNSIVRISPTGVVTTFVSGLDHPTGLAFPPSGYGWGVNLYFLEDGTDTIKYVNPAGTVSFFSNFNPSEVPPGATIDLVDIMFTFAPDGAGMYVTDAGGCGCTPGRIGYFTPLGLQSEYKDLAITPTCLGWIYDPNYPNYYYTVGSIANGDTDDGWIYLLPFGGFGSSGIFNYISASASDLFNPHSVVEGLGGGFLDAQYIGDLGDFSVQDRTFAIYLRFAGGGNTLSKAFSGFDLAQNGINQGRLLMDYNASPDVMYVSSATRIWKIQARGSPAPGDLNGDGIVNGADLGLLLASWGSSNPAADLNGDGIVNGADLGILLAHWG